MVQAPGPGFKLPERDSVFYELTRSICPVCTRVIDAQVHLKDNKVYMRKRCPEHGFFEGLVYGDAKMYVDSLKYNKPGSIPLAFATEIKDGCPHDCGLCPQHQQHTCLALIEVNTGCNLNCPICFANAGKGYNITLSEAEYMLDRFVQFEGKPEVVQFSGGEPTIHPQLPEMIEMAYRKGISYVMVNTNGLRLARDKAYVKRLADLNAIIYLQFDGLTKKTHQAMRGMDLREVKRRALDNIAEAGMNAVLVAAIERDVNVHEVGDIVRFGLEHPAVRGVNFQPVTHVGRHVDFDPMQRVTIPNVIHALEEQTGGLFVQSDFVPVPCCFPTCNAVTYAILDDDNHPTPLPRLFDVAPYLDYITNRTLVALSAEVRNALAALWSMSSVPGSATAGDNVKFACTTCGVDLPLITRDVSRKVFTIYFKDFLDSYTMDIKRLMKCCVAVMTPDGRAIPFCAYNTLGYREQVRDMMMTRQGERPADIVVPVEVEGRG